MTTSPQILPIQKRENSSFSEGIFSPSAIETYLDCPRKAYFSYSLHLKSKETSNALLFGSAIHAGVATFYKIKNLSHSELITLALQANCPQAADLSQNTLILVLSIEGFLSIWKDNPIKGDSKRNLESGMLIVTKYVSCYQNDSANYHPDYIETPVSVEMPNRTRLIAIIDRIRTQGGYIVVDTKTSSWPLTDFFFKGFINSFQLSAYYYVVQEIVGNCDGIQVDGIKVPYQEKDNFIRRIFLRTEVQMGDWLNTYLSVTNRILATISLPEEKRLLSFPCNQQSCANYGGCPYLTVCQYGFSHPLVKENFTLKQQEKEE
jgi:RecB family exonuclease